MCIFMTDYFDADVQHFLELVTLNLLVGPFMSVGCKVSESGIAVI